MSFRTLLRRAVLCFDHTCHVPYLIDVWCMCGVESHDVVCYYIFVAFTTIWCCMACSSTCVMLSVLDDNDLDHDPAHIYHDIIYMLVLNVQHLRCCVSNIIMSCRVPWYHNYHHDTMLSFTMQCSLWWRTVKCHDAVHRLFQSAVYSAMKLLFLCVRVLRRYVPYGHDIFCMVHAINVCCDSTMMCTLHP